MPIAGYRCRKPYEILTQAEIERIILGSLEILAETGMTVVHERARVILERAGCEVDHESERVKFPNDLVRWAIEKCPNTFEQRARNPDFTLRFGGETIYFGVYPGGMLLDLDTREKRASTVDDLAAMVRLVDALSEAHTLCPPTGIHDKPPEVKTEWSLATTFRNTCKVAMASSSGGSSKWVVRMCEVLDQQVHGSICLASPLLMPRDGAQGILDYASAGHPLHILSGPMKGATGPATMAGTLVLQTAEILGGTVLAQLVNPGVGVIYVGFATSMDMRFGTCASGSLETGVMGVAVAQIASFMRIPSSVFAPMTDAKLPDPQAAYEKHLQNLFYALAGINYIMPLGGLENGGGVFSPTQIVIDNEVCKMIGKTLEGIRIDDEQLAIDLIKQVGPSPGNYLKEEHTRLHWKGTYVIPEVSVREDYDAWVTGGRKGVVERATEMARNILATHEVKRIPKEKDRELDKILKAAEKEKLGN
jgi:trimethylamine--corrinoid protein Co-methyltransferase